MSDHSQQVELGSTAPAANLVPATDGPQAVSRSGVYALPVVGGPLRATRTLFDGLAPMPEDSTEVKIGKDVVRYSTVGAVGLIAGGLAAIICL